jgi:hypothetical protein
MNLVHQGNNPDVSGPSSPVKIQHTEFDAGLSKAQNNKGKRRVKPQVPADGSRTRGKKQIKVKNPDFMSSPEEPVRPVGIEKPSGFGRQIGKLNKYLTSQNGFEDSTQKEVNKMATEEKKVDQPASHMPKISKGSGLAIPVKLAQHGTRMRETLSKLAKGNPLGNKGAPQMLDLPRKTSIGKLKQGGSGILKTRREVEPYGSSTNRSQSHQIESPSPHRPPQVKGQSGLLNNSIGAFSHKDSPMPARGDTTPDKGSSKLPGLRATIQMKLQMNNPSQTKGSVRRPSINSKLSVNVGKSKNYDQYSGENKEIDNTLLNMRSKNNKMDTGKPDFFSRGNNNMKTPADHHGGPRPRSPA